MSVLSLLETFSILAEQGSFSAAARILKIQKSTVSRQLSQLEEHFGVALLQRTTRKVALTPEGRTLFAQIRVPVAELQKAELSQQAGPSGALRGRLRITAPVSLGEILLAEPIARFKLAHPEVEIHINTTDEVLDLVEQGYDLAVRAGPIEGNSLRALRLGENRFGLYATPAFTARHPRLRQKSSSDPRTLLEGIPTIQFVAGGENFEWHLHGPAKSRKVELRRPIFAESLALVRRLCLASAGVAFLPEFLAQEDEAAGRLQRILPEWASTPSRFSAVFPDHRIPSPVVREFLRYLKA